MNQHTETTRAGAELIAGLTEVLRIAIADQFPATRADVEDIEELLSALHAMRSDLVEFQMFDGLLNIVKADWRAAIDNFSALMANEQCMPGCKAMLAYCLDAISDVSWRQLALELIEDPRTNVQARVLAHALIARDDIEDARKIALRTGTFTEPESLRALNIARNGLVIQSPVPSPELASMAADASYLRL